MTSPVDLAADPPHPQESAAHVPLPLYLTALDYLLTFCFLAAGPFFFYAEAAVTYGYSRLGEAITLTLQLGVHFLAAYYFLTNHFMEPMTGEVRLVLSAWRVLLLGATGVFWFGFWQFQQGV